MEEEVTILNTAVTMLDILMIAILFLFLVNSKRENDKASIVGFSLMIILYLANIALVWM